MRTMGDELLHELWALVIIYFVVHTSRLWQIFVARLLSIHISALYCVFRVTMTHAAIPNEERAKIGITDTLVSLFFWLIATHLSYTVEPLYLP